MIIFEQQQGANFPLAQPQKIEIADNSFETAKLNRKRAISEVSQTTLSQSKKRQKTALHNLSNRIETPRVMTRDDALRLGLCHTSVKVQKLMGQFDKEEQEDLCTTKRDVEFEQLTHTEKMLTDQDCEHIDFIGKTYSQILSSQILELTALCKKGPLEEAEQILAFADKIIQTLPKQTVEQPDTTSGEPPEEFLNSSKNYFEKISGAMGIIIPEKAITDYAFKLYELSQKTDEELDQEEIDDKQETEKESEVSRILGNLLFLADQNITLAASCLKSSDIDSCSEALLTASHEQMKSARKKIDNYEQLLHHTAVHNINQTLNHYTSIEIAKHLLLSNGSLNTGFIDDAIDALLPEALESTEAIKNSYYLLSTLTATPIGAMKIYNAKPPKDKNLPSNNLVRVTLGIDPKTPITARDAQITILSGLIENVRQAKVGSCFATAWLINLLHKHIEMVIEDYIDSIEEGKLTRRIDCEVKSIPFQLRTSRESLDVTLTIDNKGYLIKKECYDKSPDEMKREPQPTGKAYIWEVPGIAAACQALGYSDKKAIVSKAFHEIGSLSFTPKQLLELIAGYSFEEDSLTTHYTRTTKKYSQEELKNIAQYAFGVQTRHALHSAWEQMGTASVSYLASQFSMSLWVYDSIKESLNPHPPASMEHHTFHRYKNKLKDAILLPMISRMRYRYNHYIEEDKQFFKGNQGVNDIGYYGYELCDTGLPEDFEYSDEIAKSLKQDSTYLLFKEFQKYPPEYNWKKVGKEQFQEFIQNIIHETVIYLQFKEQGPNRKEAIEIWKKVEKQFCKQVTTSSFLTKVTTQLLGPNERNEQRRKFKVNEFTCQSTPWLLRWGGCPDEVIKSLYGYKKDLVGMYKYTGSPPAVLAWRINYCRRQPDFIKEQFSDPFYTTVVVNPPHAYLFRPGMERFQEAINSELSASVWIDQNIIEPGMKITNQRLNIRSRKKLIDFVANNEWVRPCDQKQDLQRQELTKASKNKFDEVLAKIPNLYSGTVQEFVENIYHAVVKARAADSVIGKRNHIWEKQFKTALKNKIPSMTNGDSPIDKDVASIIIDFARNRRDVMELSKGKERFIQQMDKAPYGQSIQEFRKTLVETIKSIRLKEMGITKPDNEWIEKNHRADR